MAKKYKQLSLDERYRIKSMFLAGESKSSIARALGRAPSTVTREIKRNRYRDWYNVERAETKARRRKRLPRKPRKMDMPAINAYVKSCLELQWSPEQIAGRMRYVDKLPAHKRISHQCIYAWLLQDRDTGGTWYKHLRKNNRTYKLRRGAKGRKKVKIPDPVSIDLRPASVQTKRFLGDWEGDTIEGRKGQGLLATMVERKTLFTVIGKLSSKRADELNRAVAQRFSQTPFLPIRTITVDNGLEFAKHKQLASELNCQIYFAHAYCPHERGLNENTNGLIRQYFPKGCNFLTVDEQTIAEVERRFNNRPRRKLGYRTPAEAMQKLIRRRGVALVI